MSPDRPRRVSQKPREMCQREPGGGYSDRELWAKLLDEPDLLDDADPPPRSTDEGGQ